MDALEDAYDPNRVYSDWHELPDLILEQVFSYLSIQERYYASLVRVCSMLSLHLLCARCFIAFHFTRDFPALFLAPRSVTTGIALSTFPASGPTL